MTFDSARAAGEPWGLTILMKELPKAQCMYREEASSTVHSSPPCLQTYVVANFVVIQRRKKSLAKYETGGFECA